MPFAYYDDRESPWLLSQFVGDRAPVARVRKSAVGKLLARPLVQPLVAGCGGVLEPGDVQALARADVAAGFSGLSKPATALLERVYATPWQDFVLSFAQWGQRGRWGDQTTRNDANLVIQVGFPSDHAELMGKYFGPLRRKDLEFSLHPVRTVGRPTLAWARVDLDLLSGEALVEEVQSDWLRFAKDEVDDLRTGRPHSRALALAERYEAALVRQYGKAWSRVTLLAVLMLLRDEFACRTVWMHQPEAGAVLKGITGTPPPRSLYTDLPKRFCFAPTRDRPGFLQRLAKSRTKRLPKSGPLFWRLEFSA